MKKLTILTGSHRRNSISTKLAERFADRFSGWKITTIDTAVLNIADCTACNACAADQGNCVFKDDFDKVLPAVLYCDLIAAASPVYFSSFPSRMIRFFDRFQMLFNLEDKSGIPEKRSALILTGGAPAYPGQFDGCINTMSVLGKAAVFTPPMTAAFSNTDHRDLLTEDAVSAEIDGLARKCLAEFS